MKPKQYSHHDQQDCSETSTGQAEKTPETKILLDRWQFHA
jgi:hypothetical protein